MKKQFPLKVCPWCGLTPRFIMHTPLEETWIPRIECWNDNCSVQPKSKYVPIRKSQRANASIIKSKIEKVVDFWNSGDLFFKNEGFELDFEEISRSFLDGSIGYKRG